MTKQIFVKITLDSDNPFQEVRNALEYYGCDELTVTELPKSDKSAEEILDDKANESTFNISTGVGCNFKEMFHLCEYAQVHPVILKAMEEYRLSGNGKVEL